MEREGNTGAVTPGDFIAKWRASSLKERSAAQELRKCTLTDLYSARPQRLTDAYTALDVAVTAACGWDAGIGEDEALAALLALNSAPKPTNGF